MIAAVLVIAGIIAVGCLGYQLFRRSLGTMQSREDSLVQAAERQEEEEAAESLARRLSQEALAQQAALTEFYYNSSLTRKIVDAISDGTGRLPEEIVVCRDKVTGRTRGTKRVFDFLAERLTVWSTGQTKQPYPKPSIVSSAMSISYFMAMTSFMTIWSSCASSPLKNSEYPKKSRWHMASGIFMRLCAQISR